LLKLFRLADDKEENSISLRKTSMHVNNLINEEEKVAEDDWTKLDAFLLSPDEPPKFSKKD